LFHCIIFFVIENELQLQDAGIPKIITGTVGAIFTNQNKNIYKKLIINNL